MPLRSEFSVHLNYAHMRGSCMPRRFMFTRLYVYAKRRDLISPPTVLGCIEPTGINFKPGSNHCLSYISIAPKLSLNLGLILLKLR